MSSNSTEPVKTRLFLLPKLYKICILYNFICIQRSSPESLQTAIFVFFLFFILFGYK